MNKFPAVFLTFAPFSVPPEREIYLLHPQLLTIPAACLSILSGCCLVLSGWCCAGVFIELLRLMLREQWKRTKTEKKLTMKIMSSHSCSGNTDVICVSPFSFFPFVLCWRCSALDWHRGPPDYLLNCQVRCSITAASAAALCREEIAPH